VEKGGVRVLNVQVFGLMLSLLAGGFLQRGYVANAEELPERGDQVGWVRKKGVCLSKNHRREKEHLQHGQERRSGN